MPWPKQYKAKDVIIIFNYKKQRVNTYPRYKIIKHIGHRVKKNEKRPDTFILHNCNHAGVVFERNESMEVLAPGDATEIAENWLTVKYTRMGQVLFECDTEKITNWHNLWRKGKIFYIDPWWKRNN